MIIILPKRFELLTKTKKIPYKGTHLKTDYLLYLINHFIIQYTFDRTEIRLNASVLQQDYGMEYLRYLEYLMETGFITKSGNYSTRYKKSNKYKLIEEIDEIITHKATDYVLRKKDRIRKDEKLKNVKNDKSPIPAEIRKKLITDLTFITIDDKAALDYIESDVKDNRRKYIINLIMILRIKDEDIYWEFDKHGRFHTNFTNLKKKVRNEFLQIDGESIGSLDIPTSQPFFLALALKKDWLINDNEEVQRFIHIVEQVDIYKFFLNKYPSLFRIRDDVKPFIFKCLFDKRKNVKKSKELFRNEFPYIMDYIENYYVNNGEPLWKALQRMESHFIFSLVYPAILAKFKGIKLFSVHDSIHFPAKYFSEIKSIWDQKMAEMALNPVF